MHIMYLFALCLPILTGENAVYEVVGRKQWPNNIKVLVQGVQILTGTAGSPGMVRSLLVLWVRVSQLLWQMCWLRQISIPSLNKIMKQNNSMLHIFKWESKLEDTAKCNFKKLTLISQNLEKYYINYYTKHFNNT